MSSLGTPANIGSPEDTNILLIQVAGHDQPGLTHSFTQILAEHAKRVLDIGQAVIHNAMALGILVEVEGEISSSPLLAALMQKATESNLQVQFVSVSDQDYTGWVSQQGKRRFLVTALGRAITAQHLEKISRILAEANLNIDRVDRLSGRLPRDSAAEGSRMCIEFLISGDPSDEDLVRTRFLDLAAASEIDIAFQHDNIWRRHRRLVAFDMDSTLIQGEVIDELARENGAGDTVAAITAAAMRGEIDFADSLRRRVKELRGLPVDALERVAGRIPLTDGAERLIATLQQLGYRTAILSGGFQWFGQRLQSRLGIDYLYANELGVRDGVLTGEVHGPIVDGRRKAELLEEIARKEGISMEQVIAVGDGANDLPMLQRAGLGIAFRAKRIVRETARQSLSTLGLDAILYLIGLRDREL
ncbi:MAG: phosphoserine phosphatase SerB [Bryobacteraceae bacterium]|nr:phosphoserine phosphatase SerB [Bryobacteraceae bacterium]